MTEPDSNRQRLELLYRSAMQREFAPILDEVLSSRGRMSPSELDSYQDDIRRRKRHD